uniref:Rho-GAP domain-containing protein n=1 Tax=Syphacia muris TaxID=451379 RepID=A0A0N5AIA4_9BILA
LIYTVCLQCALSQAWKYQRKSRTWSRIVGEGSSVVHTSKFGDPKSITLVDHTEQNFLNKDLFALHVDCHRNTNVNCTYLCFRSMKNKSLQRSQSERIKERARALMKRMDIRSSSRRRKQRNEHIADQHEMVIGDPVLVSHCSVSPHCMRIYPDALLNSKSLRTGNIVVTERSPSSLESSGNDDDARHDSTVGERRDSGVGSSLSRSPRYKTETFLRLSAMLERYAGNGVTIGSVSGNTSNGGIVKNWAVQKFRKKLRNSDSKPLKDLSIFGLSLTTVQSLTGLVLPRSILEIMQFLRTVASDTIGIFRKNGVRSRIMELRALCAVSPEEEVFPNGKGLDLSQVHDIADMLKQYFRELPEPLMTAKYSDVFANIFLYIPKNFRSEALQHALLLLPDENREALQTLLFFLHDIAKHSALNNMNSQNLAVCFAPSLFHLGVSRLNSINPTSRHKTIGAAGMPTEREMKESRAAQECLVQMIDDCVKLFITPPFEADSSTYEADILSLTDTNSADRANLKEHRDRFKGWYVEGMVNGVEVSSKKSERNPLRYFRVWVDVEAPPREIITRIVRERNVWDKQTINWRTLYSSASENCDIFQYVINDTTSHPTRDVIVIRYELRGGCILVEKSIRTNESHLLGGIPATVFSSRFLIEPNSGCSRVTYISRVDLGGRGNLWYRKVYGNIIARQMLQLRDSFRHINRSVDGPETKI